MPVSPQLGVDFMSSSPICTKILTWLNLLQVSAATVNLSVMGTPCSERSISQLLPILWPYVLSLPQISVKEIAPYPFSLETRYWQDWLSIRLMCFLWDHTLVSSIPGSGSCALRAWISAQSGNMKGARHWDVGLAAPSSWHQGVGARLPALHLAFLASWGTNGMTWNPVSVNFTTRRAEEAKQAWPLCLEHPGDCRYKKWSLDIEQYK